MKSILMLSHLHVENANAISGLTYGFPAISHFLGFTHALSRHLQQAFGLTLDGCAVVVHNTALHSQPLGNRREQVFAITRNPLTKNEKTAPFNEEGRLHMNVTLLMECDFSADELPEAASLAQSVDTLQAWIAQKVPTMRLAGGTIVGLQQVRWQERLDDAAQHRLRMNLLPGFALVCRHDVLISHHQRRLQESADAELLDSLLDFVTVKQQAQQHDNGTVSWPQQPKPASGYLVPIAVGFQAIGALQQPGALASSRDKNTPFRLVESVYTLGQWLSPHRVTDIDVLFWRYHYDEPYYLCQNHYMAPSAISDDEYETRLANDLF